MLRRKRLKIITFLIAGMFVSLQVNILSFSAPSLSMNGSCSMACCVTQSKNRAKVCNGACHTSFSPTSHCQSDSQPVSHSLAKNGSNLDAPCHTDEAQTKNLKSDSNSISLTISTQISVACAPGCGAMALTLVLRTNHYLATLLPNTKPRPPTTIKYFSYHSSLYFDAENYFLLPPRAPPAISNSTYTSVS